MPANANIHGRKWGRGIRPWILLPKYLCVSLLLGGLVATLVLLPQMPEDGADPRWRLLLRVYDYTIIPATAGAVLFGVLLLLQHPREFLKMRWLRLKLAAVVLVVPISHLMLSRQFGHAYMVWEFVWQKTFISLAAFVVIAILGRLKPRLGQRYGAG